MLHKGWTTKQLEEDMSGPDMELLIHLFDVLEKFENKTTSIAVNQGMWGKNK